MATHRTPSKKTKAKKASGKRPPPAAEADWEAEHKKQIRDPFEGQDSIDSNYLRKG